MDGQPRLRSGRRGWAVGLTVTVTLATLAVAEPSGAVVPGGNGRIAFTRTVGSTGEVFVTNADGSGQLQLTSNTALDNEPSWSPDGTRIAFTSSRDGNSEIYVMNADGTAQTRLTTNTSADTEPTWSPDGTRIAFSSTRNNNYEIYVMNADGTAQTRLTTNVASDNAASWSPDGSRIAFTSTRDGSQEIYVMNADGTAPNRLTSNASLDLEPSWSPSGTRIAFVSDRDGNFEVYTITAAGGGLTRITTNSWPDRAPTWSPNGALIAFASSPTLFTKIHVTSSAGTGTPVNVSGTANTFDTAPDWGVAPYAFTGFLGPVLNPPVVNVVRADRTVPLTFSLGGDKGLDVFRAGYPKVTTMPCAEAAGIPTIATTRNIGLQYNRLTRLYTYGLQIPRSWAGTCATFDLGLKDGSSHPALFRFR